MSTWTTTTNKKTPDPLLIFRLRGGEKMKADFLIKNGCIVDPARGIETVADVAVARNKIVPSTGVDAGQVIDASGCYVLPGLIDFHTHIFLGGTQNGANPNFMCASGVTAAVDAGSSGCTNYRAFRKSTVETSSLCVKTYLSCCSIGLAGGAYLENFSPELFDKDGILQLKEEFPDDILGLKIRIPKQLVHDLRPLEKAIELAEEIGNMSVCVHVTNAPASMADVAKILRRGDIFCHAYHGTGQTILSENGDVLPAIREARERGILFDMSHGNTNFSNAVCQKALAQGFPPDIISTDMGVVRFYQGRRVRSLPFVMSKLLSFGMTMIDVVRCVTATPAKSMNMSGVIGTLGAGARADIAIVKKVAREVHFEDASGSSCSGNVLLLPQMTMLSGQSVFIMNDFNL